MFGLVCEVLDLHGEPGMFLAELVGADLVRVAEVEQLAGLLTQSAERVRRTCRASGRCDVSDHLDRSLDTGSVEGRVEFRSG